MQPFAINPVHDKPANAQGGVHFLHAHVWHLVYHKTLQLCSRLRLAACLQRHGVKCNTNAHSLIEGAACQARLRGVNITLPPPTPSYSVKPSVIHA